MDVFKDSIGPDSDNTTDKNNSATQGGFQKNTETCKILDIII